MTAKLTNVYAPDITSWDFDAVDELVDALEAAIQKTAKRAANEALKVSTETDHELCFGLEWGRHKDDPEYPGDDGRGGEQIDDPYVMLLEIPLREFEEDRATWRFSLSDAMDKLIDLHERPGPLQIIDGHNAKRFRPLVEALRELADRLEAKLEKP